MDLYTIITLKGKQKTDRIKRRECLITWTLDISVLEDAPLFGISSYRNYRNIIRKNIFIADAEEVEVKTSDFRNWEVEATQLVDG